MMGEREGSTWHRVCEDELCCVNSIRMTLKHPLFYVKETPGYVERCPGPGRVLGRECMSYSFLNSDQTLVK